MITQNGHINIRNGNFDICMKCVLMLLNYSVQTLLFEHNHNKIFEDLEKNLSMYLSVRVYHLCIALTGALTGCLNPEIGITVSCDLPHLGIGN